jgi:hypothetical protein
LEERKKEKYIILVCKKSEDEKYFSRGVESIGPRGCRRSDEMHLRNTAYVHHIASS